MTTTTTPDTQPAPKPESAVHRQFVNFMFFRVDRAFRALPADVRVEARREFAELLVKYSGPMIVLPYSTVGIKAGVDFMLWRIGYDLDPFQRMAAEINKSVL